MSEALVGSRTKFTVLTSLCSNTPPKPRDHGRTKNINLFKNNLVPTQHSCKSGESTSSDLGRAQLKQVPNQPNPPSDLHSTANGAGPQTEGKPSENSPATQNKAVHQGEERHPCDHMSHARQPKQPGLDCKTSTASTSNIMYQVMLGG